MDQISNYVKFHYEAKRRVFSRDSFKLAVDNTPTVGTRKKSASKKRDVSYYAISSRLGEFRISRNVISLTDDIKKSEAQVRKVKGSIYKKESSLFFLSVSFKLGCFLSK